MKQFKYAAVLTIAGSDSGGGAGIQADLKTFSALGCYGTSAITSVTVQNTVGVSGIHNIPPDIVIAQVRAVMDDIEPFAIKIGMVHSAALALAIANILADYPDIPIILDPVMVATSGDRLIAPETVSVLRKKLFPLATLVTPNLDETEILVGSPVKDVDAMKAAARTMLQDGCNAVLIKGGHLQGDTRYNYYLNKNGEDALFGSEAIYTYNTHGTGCTLSSAIAAFIARGMPLQRAIAQAGFYIHEAILQGSDVVTGKGHGPVNHFFDPQPLRKYELE